MTTLEFYTFNVFQVFDKYGWSEAIKYLRNEHHAAQCWWFTEKKRKSMFGLWCHIILQEIYALLDIQYLMVGICEIYGHKWHVEASIGPESGSEYFECKRCGESHNITYY